MHSYSGVTYRPTLCEWRPSHTCRANLSECLKQFSLPARQCQHTCNTARKMFASWPCQTPWPASQVPIHLWSTTPGIIWTGGYMIVSLPSRHISLIGTLASWTIGNAFHKGLGEFNQKLLLSLGQRLIECIHKGGGHTRYELQYINLLQHVHVCSYFQQRRMFGMAFFLLAWVYYKPRYYYCSVHNG